jgi:hypothetical protein
MSEKTRMTDAQVMAELQSDSPLNRARRAFSAASARIDQAQSQRHPISPVEVRRREFEAVQEIVAAAKPEPTMASLDERMKAAGMIPLSDLLNGGQPLDRWTAHAGVQCHDSFEVWLRRRYEEFMRMRMSYELGDEEKDDLYEWVFAHAAAFGEVMTNWRAMKARMEARAEAGSDPETEANRSVSP